MNSGLWQTRNRHNARVLIHLVTIINSCVCDLNHPTILTVTATLEAARKFPYCEVRHARDCHVRDCESGPAEPGVACQNGRLLAGGELSVRWPDLSARQCSAGAAAYARRREAASAGSLGHDAGPEFSVRAMEPADPRARAGHDLRHRPGARRPGNCGEHLSRRIVLGDLSPHRAGQGRHQAPVPAIQLALRHSQPRGAGDAGLHPRGRRAGLLAGARLRRGLR